MEENSESSQNQKRDEESEIYVKEEEIEWQRQTLPLATNKSFPNEMIKYQNFWYDTAHPMFRNIVSIQKHFVVRGWLKSLLFATVHRTNYSNNLLIHHHPQELVYNLENDVYNEAFVYPRPRHLPKLPPPRLFSTHVPFTTLPESVKTISGCQILYICRNPLDRMVSDYYFLLEYAKKRRDELGDQDAMPMVAPTLEECFENFCEGKFMFGPFFEHVLEYWKMSIERPDKVLYGDLKADPSLQLKRIAEFIGMSSFSPQEEKEGVIQ